MTVREIKFRAWDGGNKRMMYRMLWDRSWYGTPKNDEGGCHCLQTAMPNDQRDYETMQFTGLKDKNGKEIYEGDVVRIGDVITGSVGLTPGFVWGETDRFEIGFLPQLGSFGVIPKKPISSHEEGAYHNQAWGLIRQGDCEVIGNIYENPELLK